MQSDGSGSVSTIISIQGFRDFVHRWFLGHLKQLRKILMTAPCVLGPLLPGSLPDLLQQGLIPVGNHSLTCSFLVALCSPTLLHWGSISYLHSCSLAGRAARESCLRRQLIEVLQIPALPNSRENRGQNRGFHFGAVVLRL